MRLPLPLILAIAVEGASPPKSNRQRSRLPDHGDLPDLSGKHRTPHWLPGGEVDGEPDRGRVALRPDHAVAAMRREKQPVAGAKLALLRFARDEETRGAGHEQHPLVVLLIVPLSFGRRLSGRYDPLDAEPFSPAERLGELRGKRPGGKAAPKVPGFRFHRRSVAFNRVYRFAAFRRLTSACETSPAWIKALTQPSERLFPALSMHTRNAALSRP